MLRTPRARGGLLAPSVLALLAALATVGPGCGCGRPVGPLGAAITVSPAGAPAGATVELTVRGTVYEGEPLTDFGPDTTMTFDGVPVAVTVEDRALLTATVSIAPDHPPGPVQIVVENAVAGEADPLTTPFNILDPGLVGTITISPAWGTAGLDTVLTVTGVNVEFMDGVTGVDFDSDLVTPTTPVTVVSSTVLSFGVHPDATLPNGFVTLTVFNGEEFVAQGAWGIVNPSTIGTIEVTPPRVPRGARNFSLEITGQDITFAEGSTVAEFSAAGITVRSTSVQFATSMTVAIDVAPEAELGEGILVVHDGPAKAWATFIVDDRVVPGAAVAGAPVPPGATVTAPVTTAGLVLDPASTVAELTPGSGLEGANFTVTGTTSGTLGVTVARGTPPGFAPFALHDWATDERIHGAIAIAPAGPPEVAAVSPPSIPSGGAGTFALSGSGTGFVSGVTVATIVPLGAAAPGEVTAGAVTVLAPDAATVDLSALPGATAGPAILRLTTGPEVAEGLLLVTGAAAAGLVPAEIGQGRTVVAELVVDGLDLASPLASVTSLAPDDDGDALPDVWLELFAPVSTSRARLTLVASDAAAAPGVVQLLVEDGGGLPLVVDVGVLPGTPGLSRPTDSIRPGDVFLEVSVVGHFITIGPATVAAIPGLPDGLYVERTGTPAADVATVHLTAAVDLPPGAYPLVIATGAEAVATTLTVEPITIGPLALPGPGGESTVPGSLSPGGGNSAAFYAFSPAPGDVVTFTADSGALSTLDPALSLYAADGVTVLAENDDLDALTLAAQVTWAFDAAGTYYLRVLAETAAGGAYTLRTRVLDAPLLEAEPDDDPSAPFDLGGDPLAAAGAILLRGDVGAPDDVDYFRFDVGTVTAGDPLAQIVVDTAARGLVDHLGAVPDLVIEIVGPDGLPVFPTGPTLADDRAVPSGHLFDPSVAFAPPAPGPYLVKVSSYAGTTGPYLLNLRGPLAINEVFYNPQGSSGAGTFLELSGVAGLAAAPLMMEVRAYDCAGLLDPVSGLDTALPLWASVVFPADGFYVFAADATVAMYDVLVPEELVDFSEADGTRIDLVVTPPGGVERVIDSVHFASAPAMCAAAEGGFAPNPADGADTSIGRGFGFDSDDNTRDFFTQLRPSPGERNVTNR